MLYYDLVFVHKNAIPITNPHPITASAFVKEVSVNDSTSKNDKDAYTQSSPILLPQVITTTIIIITLIPLLTQHRM
jgi:hypothetical protein